MPKKNAYFLFMVDFKKDQEAKYGRKLSMAEVSELASSSWMGLSYEIRELYKYHAKNSEFVEKKCSQGVPFSVVERIQTEKVELEKGTIERIHNLLNHFTVPVGICSYPIFLISANYFYRRRENFVPAEVALIKFTFLEGIQERYHAFLNPGSIEMGFAADAKVYSESTHMLPLPPHAFGERKFHAVFFNIWKILTNVARIDSGKPFVFTYTNDYASEEDSVSMLKSVLSQLYSSQKEVPIDVYPLSRLFFVLASKLFESGRLHHKINMSIVNMQMSRDAYEYRSGFSCVYHERVDACAHCALSKASRWAYLLAKHLCEPLAIDLVFGKHLPFEISGNQCQSFQSLEESDVKRFNDDCESQSNASHRSRPLTRYNSTETSSSNWKNGGSLSFNNTPISSIDSSFFGVTETVNEPK